MPDPHAERYVVLEGCYNFRDLGGYRARDGRVVRRGVLYRSDALHHLTDADVRRVRDELGVRAVIDVRSARELGPDRASALARPPVAYHHLPLFRDETRAEVDEVPMDLGDRYFHMLQFAAAPLREVLELIAQLPDPAVFHCAAGKDRTGLIAALVLSLVGVPEEDVVEDYVATSRNLDRIVERLRATPGYEAVFTELPPETLHAEPETMQSLLEQVNRIYGSVRGYAREIDLSDAALASLEARLLARA